MAHFGSHHFYSNHFASRHFGRRLIDGWKEIINFVLYLKHEIEFRLEL